MSVETEQTKQTNKTISHYFYPFYNPKEYVCCTMASESYMFVIPGEYTGQGFFVLYQR